MKRINVLIAVFIMMMFVISCDKEKGVKLSYEKSEVEVAVGDKINLKPIIELGEKVKKYSLTYKLSNTIATIDKDGNLEAKEAGTTILTVIADDKDNSSATIKVYIINKFTINLNSDGGITDESIITFKDGLADTVVLPKPVKEGHKFIGWYEGDLLIESIENRNYDLIAKYEKIYTITVYFNNGEENQVIEVVEGTTLAKVTDLYTPSYAGYAFADFYYDEEFTLPKKPNLKITKDTTLYAKWLKLYYVNCELNGGIMKEELVSEYTEEDVEYSDIELQHPTKENYYFRGWFDNSSFEGKPIYKITYETVKDYMLYAKWEEAKIENAYVSIIGDSISAFEGMIPSGYDPCYCYTKNNGCLTVEDMWWRRLQQAIGFKQGTINAYAGTTVMKVYGASTATETISRLQRCVPANKIGPDIIVIYMGTNDSLVNNLSISAFEKSYRNMLNNIYSLLPNVQIFVANLAWEKYTVGTSEYDSHVKTVEEVNSTIQKLATEYELPLIDFKSVYNTDTNDYDTLYDKIHPTAFGQRLLAEKAIEAFKQFYGL